MFQEKVVDLIETYITFTVTIVYTINLLSELIRFERHWIILDRQKPKLISLESFHKNSQNQISSELILYFQR
jgi:hypothetical protein